MRKLFSNKWIYYIEMHRVTKSVIKMTFFTHGGISIKIFVVYLHSINECLSYKFHPYSILTGHTKVKSVAYQVLIEFLPLFVILTLFVPPGPALHLNVVDNFLIFQKNILNSTYIFDLGKLLQQLFLKLLIMNLSDCFTICVTTNFLSLVSHKKSYFVCVEFSNIM